MNEQKSKEKKQEETLIRILSTDVSSNSSVYAGLTNIKGVGWTLSKAVCYKLDIDENRRFGDLSKEEINKISEVIKNPEFPRFIMNRPKDLETGEAQHLIGSDLNLRKEFDIKRLKKIKSYRGWRHSKNRPVRGQRTRGNFRTKSTLGVQKTKQVIPSGE